MNFLLSYYCTCRYWHCCMPHFCYFAADTLALLFTDVLVFLQEKDQRFIFAAVVSPQTLEGFEVRDTKPESLCPFLSIP